MNEIAKPEIREGHLVHSLLSMEHFPHYMKVAEMLSKSTMIPKNMIGKPSDILIAMDMALQLGIPLLQGIQDIAVVNGKPCLYSDGLLAVVQGHKDYEWMKEECVNGVATCTIKRKHHEPHVVKFSIDDAKKASLWGKQGPWSQYPDRMLQMRARGFAIRDTFSDALRGIKTEEEIRDYPKEEKLVEDDLKAIVGSVVSEADLPITDSQISTLRDLYASVGRERFNEVMKECPSNLVNDLTKDEAKELIKKLEYISENEESNA